MIIATVTYASKSSWKMELKMSAYFGANNFLKVSS